MTSRFIAILLLCLLSCTSIAAQESPASSSQSLSIQGSDAIAATDHASHRASHDSHDSHDAHDSIARTPNSMRAVWMGAIIPGYGQIYNRSYWKLPIVYGAFMGCAYAVSAMNGRYEDYKTAYYDLYTDLKNGQYVDDPSKSYIAIIPPGYNIENVGGPSQWQSTLQKEQNTYHRYRDLSIVATIAVYALSLIDAFVDAELSNFDISPDLANQMPTPNPMAETSLIQSNQWAHCNQSAGLKFSIKF